MAANSCQLAAGLSIQQRAAAIFLADIGTLSSEYGCIPSTILVDASSAGASISELLEKETRFRVVTNF
jgi:pyruvate/2-oxoglutarate dehydrogenase complex dihydrolipoamide dehydrogenase (E3) component